MNIPLITKEQYDTLSRNINNVIIKINFICDDHRFENSDCFLHSLRALYNTVEFCAPEMITEMWQRLSNLLQQYISPLESTEYNFIALECSKIITGKD